MKYEYTFFQILLLKKKGLKHYATYALSLGVQDTHQNLRHKQKLLQLSFHSCNYGIFIGRFTYSPWASFTHNCRSLYTSCVTETPVQSSKRIKYFTTSTRITLGKLLCIISGSTITGTEGKEHVAVFVMCVFSVRCDSRVQETTLFYCHNT